MPFYFVFAFFSLVSETHAWFDLHEVQYSTGSTMRWGEGGFASLVTVAVQCSALPESLCYMTDVAGVFLFFPFSTFLFFVSFLLPFGESICEGAA